MSESLTGWARTNRTAVLGALATFVSALALFTRFSLDGSLERDEAIYVYGAERFSHGVPPYVSIFDPKTPVATLLGGFGAGVARLVGSGELYGIRVEFLILSLLTVVAVYLLALELFGSVGGAVVAGIAFSCYTTFADDAMAGPDAKTPGVLFMVVCMLLLVRRRWFAAGVIAGLTFLVWQPLFFFAVVAVAAATVSTGAGRRRRAAVQAALGVACPVAVVSLYFLVAGAFSEFVTSAFVYPLTGTVREPESFRGHILRVIDTIDQFTVTGLIFWVGSACLVWIVALRFRRNAGTVRSALADPLVLVVTLTFALNLLYALCDFQRAPDTLPFMPYPVLGLAGAVAEMQRAASRRPALLRAVTAAALAVVLAVAAVNLVRFGRSHSERRGLVSELREACGVDRIAGPQPIVALGNPTVLVLLDRVSRSNYIYLDAGVDRWKVEHTPGGFPAWARAIVAQHPDVINIDGWEKSPYVKKMRHFLADSGYLRRYVGDWQVYVTDAARHRARQDNVRLTVRPKRVARNREDGKLPGVASCPLPAGSITRGPLRTKYGRTS